ncbi:MAG: NAD-dependent epimerase/dehydratase family protein, partial [Rhodospirillaceae bacterium]|nr:NAD-dependent epimerase/dehydratase family protein [Rhodospirillaceae bacterium]
MKVVITGGTGFLGLRLARKILERRTLTGASGQQEPVEQLILFDAVTPAERPAGLDDRVTITSGDVADEKTIMGMVNGASLSVFHLASVVSAGAEQDFDLALEVNLDGGLNLLEACRAAPGLPRFVFTSSLAVFGGAAMPAEVGDDTKITPQNTYGMTKVINELLVNDYTRKGFLDGRG